MQVGVGELRDNLSRWISRVKRGQEIVIKERGKPVARLTNVIAARLTFPSRGASRNKMSTTAADLWDRYLLDLDCGSPSELKLHRIWDLQIKE